MRLTPAMERYVLHWGEMGARWGVNRSVAQIHALLYLAPHPLTAEEIADTLAIARSNVSMSLKELLAWGVAASTALTLETACSISAPSEGLICTVSSLPTFDCRKPCAASSPSSVCSRRRSEPRTLTNTRACLRSEDVSTPVIVTKS